jgi:hypothetical protein
MVMGVDVGTCGGHGFSEAVIAGGVFRQAMGNQEDGARRFGPCRGVKEPQAGTGGALQKLRAVEWLGHRLAIGEGATRFNRVRLQD